jgi:diguanylate cyclase (GGDEF)-like protein
VTFERGGEGKPVGFVQWLQPRDHFAAGRTVSTLSLVAAGVTLVFALVQVAESGAKPIDLIVAAVAAAAIVAAGWAARRLGDAHPVVWAVCPLAATGLIVALDFMTEDATLTAQVFLFFPALYAASELRRPGAALVATAVVLAELAITIGMLPFRVALVEATYMIAALVTTVVLLTVAGERQDRLIALLARQAAIDPLTGLVTRRVLDEAARAALSGAASRGGTGLVLIDVDDFKGINDAHGHPAGDEVLVQLAGVLTRNSRATDIVSRLGGDEIALLLPGLSVIALADRGQQILAQVRDYRFVLGDGSRVPVSISGGIAHAPTQAADLRTLYSAADTALYSAKRLGRNQFCISTTPDMPLAEGDHDHTGPNTVPT